ncbi:ATP-binding protein [uncultured Dysgonomonas sp.]|uniref:AAA family ATPase n=1 Tax=uncultured Dysgonomonas sp. TaxID=206096 RepID=UPI0028052D07|nr:ATP-binding protein [uncultured Dysgonomonas sp.]
MFLIEEFSFGNFKSFKDIQTLRMSKANIKSSNESLDENNIIEINEKIGLLKSKVIYGANASGKSNVIKALMTFCDIILKCLSEGKNVTIADKFLFAKGTRIEPTFFQLIFYIDDVKYRYGFESSDQKIDNEWLYITHSRETPVFIREKQKITVTKSHMAVGFDIANMKSKLLSEKSLFLSVADSFSDKLANKIVDSIRLFMNNNENDDENKNNFLDNKVLKRKIIDLLKYADIGISDLDSIELGGKEKDGKNENKKYLLGIHKEYNEDLAEVGNIKFIFDTMESEGTKEMLNNSLSILSALELGIPLVIDEFGAKLHPLLTKKILSLFNSKENKTSQLIVVTHTTELMSPDLLRRDQIDFVEKDKYGRSYLYTLVELKGIREKGYEKDYLQGKYGGIPFLGDWDNFCKMEDNTIEK